MTIQLFLCQVLTAAYSGYCVKLNGIPAIECIPEVIAAFALIHPCIFY
jgi:hypothetical protein